MKISVFGYWECGYSAFFVGTVWKNLNFYDIMELPDEKLVHVEVKDMEILRAEALWQRAGAYSVRIQGMNRQHGISLKEEFDEHDGEETKYIVILDDGYPVATCRFYEIEGKTVMLGRVVVLPEYRGRGIGRLVVREAEEWIWELGFRKIKIESRINASDFYKKLGYEKVDGKVFKNGVFECVCMEKFLENDFGTC